jgi:hypothetical protein
VCSAVSLPVATGFADLRMRAHPEHPVTTFIPAVVTNSEPAPARHRILAPFLNYHIGRVTGASEQSVWYATRLAWILLAYCVMHAYLRNVVHGRKRPGGRRDDGCDAAADVHQLLGSSGSHAGAGALYARRPCCRARVRLAVCDRPRRGRAESGDVCIPRGAVRRGRTVGARPVLRGGLFGLEWLAIYAGLRVWRGLQHYDYWQAGRNLTDLTFPLPSEHYDPYYRASRTSSS